MTTPKPRNWMKTAFYILITTILISFVGTNHAQAFQKKAADTVSTGDVQFTDIPTAADSIKARKDAAAAKYAQQAQKNASKVVSAQVTDPEKSKGLWETFLIGFALGFAAFLMPCI